MSKALTAAPSGSVEVVQAVRSRLPSLDPYLVAERLSEAYGRKCEHVLFPAMPAMPTGEEPTGALLEYRRGRLAEAIRLNPTVGQAQALIDAITPALSAPPSRPVTRTAIALMLDTRTKLPRDPGLYVEAASHDVMELGFSPHVVVAACQVLRREATFAPEIAELIAACRTVADRYGRHVRWAEAALPTLRRVEALIAAERP